MFDYRLTVAAPLSHREPLAYSMSPRTVPTFVRRFTTHDRLPRTGQRHERRILA